MNSGFLYLLYYMMYYMHRVCMFFWLRPQINYSLSLGQDMLTLENNSVVAMSCFH